MDFERITSCNCTKCTYSLIEGVKPMCIGICDDRCPCQSDHFRSVNEALVEAREEYGSRNIFIHIGRENDIYNRPRRVVVSTKKKIEASSCDQFSDSGRETFAYITLFESNLSHLMEYAPCIGRFVCRKIQRVDLRTKFSDAQTSPTISKVEDRLNYVTKDLYPIESLFNRDCEMYNLTEILDEETSDNSDFSDYDDIFIMSDFSDVSDQDTSDTSPIF